MTSSKQQVTLKGTRSLATIDRLLRLLLLIIFTWLHMGISPMTDGNCFLTEK